MNHRIAAGALAAGMLFTGSHIAMSMPLPDPPPRISAQAHRDAAILELAAAYRTAALHDKRSIHSEMTLILHRPKESWAQ